MIHDLLDPNDPPERQTEKLVRITEALMRRMERNTNTDGAAYAQFQRAAMLEQEVQARTRDLEHTLDLLNMSNAKLAEANREAEEARSNLANAIETVQEGFALFDPEERLVMCNSRFGLHMPDIRARVQPGLTFREYVDLVSRSRYRERVEDETPADWARRRMKRHEDDHVIFNVRMIWNRWVQVSEHRTPDGGTVILQTDVTDIMRLERQERDRMLDDQSRVIRATLEQLDQGVSIFDAQARLVGWNQRVGTLLSVPARLLRIGTRFATLLGHFRDDVTFLDGTTIEDLEAWVDRSDGRPPLNFEITRGPMLILAVHAQEMPDQGFLVSVTDVTAERTAVRAIKEANERLEARVAERTLALEDALAEAERANASKSRFVAAASHDLLQPLSAAKLYLSSLSGELPVVDKVNRALESVEHILDVLLDISKLDIGKASLHIAPIPVQLVIDQLVEEFTPMARQKGLDLRAVPTRAIVESDPTYLRRILQNLLSNAIRYTSEGRVLIGARRQGARLRVEVWDTGPGIDADEQKDIFDEFRRLNASASAADGMGLGLAIVERACRLLDHDLDLVSAPGQGTGFKVTLPRAAPAARPDAARRAGALQGPGGQGAELVLLIENDAEVLRALTTILEKWDLGVLAAQGPAEADALLHEIGVTPDAIIADYQLDDGALGTDTIAAIRARLGPVPACIVTADRSPELLDNCAAAGIRLFPKPIEPAELAAFLADVPTNT
ncbi:MAG: PAS-domain containing protein [Maritimibacter harenae]